MRVSNLWKSIANRLDDEGFHARNVSIEHLAEMKNEIEGKHQEGLFDETFYGEELAGFEFDIDSTLPAAKSLIVVAAPQPQVKAMFTLQGSDIPGILPPVYSYETDRRIESLLEKRLTRAGYRLHKVTLPWKLLAVRSGLAQYGKNNISYIDGMGSFYRLVAFASDLPIVEDNWIQPQMLDACQSCDACRRACPTGAIAPDRFLLHAERCLTFHNERQGPFPEWIKPDWHNCLVGCMICQKVCPQNKSYRKWIEDGPRFSEDETTAILSSVSESDIPKTAIEKMEALDIIEYAEMIGRNLRVLKKKV